MAKHTHTQKLVKQLKWQISSGFKYCEEPVHQFPEEATGQGRACKTHELLGAGATFPLRAADISHMKGFPYSHTSGKERQKRGSKEMAKRR